jgi:UDP-2,4-diacetamido-2,4,6-trideoxy-beta-L-altropyranose hydrolase
MPNFSPSDTRNGWMTELLFRLDGGPGIGAGHFMRCLSLAQAAAELGWRSHLALSHETAIPPAWAAQAGSIHFLGHVAGSDSDCASCVELVRRLNAAWVVTDHYAFDNAFLENLAHAVPHTLLIDDLGERDAAVDLVLNPNPGAESRWHDRYAKAHRSLLGADYFLLRASIDRARPMPETGRVLITFGADDTDNLALEFVRHAIAAGIALNADVICTAHRDGLEQLRSATAGALGNWRIHAGPLEIAPLMARAALLVCAGGGTASEAASLGIPSVIVVRADNQRPGAQSLADAGAALLAGEGAAALPQALESMRRLLENDKLRVPMANAGRSLIDGSGARRVIEAMRDNENATNKEPNNEPNQPGQIF